MKSLLLMSDGQIPPKVLQNFGGEFSLFEKIKMGGIGSPKLILQANIPILEDLQLEENVLIYSNLEILKDGFVVRAWQNRFFRGMVFGTDEIQSMKFEKYRVIAQKPNIFAGHFTFSLTHTDIQFFIPPNSFKAMAKFLRKKPFHAMQFEETEDRNPEELVITGINIISFLKS